MVMRGMWWRQALPAAAAALGLLSWCGGGAQAVAPPARAPGTAVVVASFNFPESDRLAATYALALLPAGIPACSRARA